MDRIILSRNFNLSEVQEKFKVTETTVRTNLYFDSENNYFIIGKNLRADKYIPIERLRFCLQNLSKKNIRSVHSGIYQAVRKWEKENKVRICGSHARSITKNERILSKAFVCEKDNPYYKCSSPMKLYDKNVIYHWLVKEAEAA